MKEKKPFTQWFFKGFWPYWLGAILIGILNVILTIIYRPFGITSNLGNWGLHTWSLLGGHPESLTDYFNAVGMDYFSKSIFYSETTVLNLGIIFGSLLAVVMASQFKLKKVKSAKQLLLGLTGGLMMGYGARLALGCNIGVLIGGISSQSLHGWVFALFLFFGCLTGCFVIKRINTHSKA